jgi:hypothetical protein
MYINEQIIINMIISSLVLIYYYNVPLVNVEQIVIIFTKYNTNYYINYTNY